MQAIADGGQPIAKCELAMLPILLYHERCTLEKRDIVWLVGNTAALGGVIKGASGLAVSEQLIASFWMLAFALDLRLLDRVRGFEGELVRWDQPRLRR